MLLLQKPLAMDPQKADSVGSNQPRCANFHQFTGQPGLALGSATTRDPQRDPQGRRTDVPRGGGNMQ